MATWKEDHPHHKANGIDRFFFPPWKSYLDYYPGNVVASSVLSPVQPDSEVSITVPGYSYEDSETVQGTFKGGAGEDGEYINFISQYQASNGWHVVEAKAPDNLVLNWDSENQTWIPETIEEFSGAFSISAGVDLNVIPTIEDIDFNSAAVFEDEPQVRNLNFASGGNLNIDPVTYNRTDGSFFRGCWNDGGALDYWGDGSDVWLFYDNNLLQETSFKGKDFGTIYQADTSNPVSTEVFNGVTGNKIGDFDIYGMKNSHQAQKDDGRVRVVKSVQQPEIYYREYDDTWFNIGNVYADGPRYAFTWPAATNPHGVDVTYIVSRGKIVSSTLDSNNNLTGATPERAVVGGTLSIRMHNDKGTEIVEVPMLDIVRLDGGPITDDDLETETTARNPISGDTLYYKRVVWAFYNGDLVEQWIDYGGESGNNYINEGSVYDFAVSYSNSVSATLNTRNQDGTIKNTYNATAYGFYTRNETAVEELQGNLTETRFFTVTVPERQVTVSPGNSSISYWIATDHSKGVNPEDSENAESVWRLFYDYTFDSILNEMEGVIRYAQTNFNHLLGVDWDDEISSLSDSDSDAVVRFKYVESKFDSDVIYEIDNFVEEDAEINKRIDSELDGFDKLVSDRIDDFENRFDSDSDTRVERDLGEFFKALDSEESNREADERSVKETLNRLIETWNIDSEIMYQIINYPKQTYNDSDFNTLTSVENYQNVLDTIDSDLIKLDSDILFRLLKNGTAYFDSEYLRGWDSDWKHYADSEISNLSSFNIESDFGTIKPFKDRTYEKIKWKSFSYTNTGTGVSLSYNDGYFNSSRVRVFAWDREDFTNWSYLEFTVTWGGEVGGTRSPILTVRRHLWNGTKIFLGPTSSDVGFNSQAAYDSVGVQLWFTNTGRFNPSSGPYFDMFFEADTL